MIYSYIRVLSKGNDYSAADLNVSKRKILSSNYIRNMPTYSTYSTYLRTCILLTMCRGLPTRVGKTAFGVPSPEKPAWKINVHAQI